MVIRSLVRKPVHFFALVSLFIFLCSLLMNCKKNDRDNNNNNLTDSTKVDLQLVADGFISPIGVVASPDNTGRLFVIDQAGKIWIIDQSGNKLSNPFIDVTSTMVPLNAGYDERGLLGLAFHPQFATNHKFYIYYQLPPRTGNNLSRIAEFQTSTSNANVADMASEKILLELNDPQSNHNGGTLAFGPDGLLYIAIGDGGGLNDVGTGHVDDWYAANAGGNGQDITSNLLGNILRIDVDNGSPYSIPPDNPFVGKDGLDEIYAYGFRNPYRMSFDMGGNHDLIAGDAGQSLYEEIDLVIKGGNYGWNVKEGTHCFNTNNDSRERNACPVEDSAGNPLLDPVIEVKNLANPEGGGLMNAIVGGNVYRGTALPNLFGRYVFGGFSSDESKAAGKIYVAKSSTIGLWSFEELNLKSFPGDINQYLKGFGQDQDGEVYVTATRQLGPQGVTGKVWKLVAAK